MNLNENKNLIKKLLYQSKNRGYKETDLILGAFSEENLCNMTLSQLQHFTIILDHSDADIYDWITNKTLPPKYIDSNLINLLKDYSLNKIIK